MSLKQDEGHRRKEQPFDNVVWRYVESTGSQCGGVFVMQLKFAPVTGRSIKVDHAQFVTLPSKHVCVRLTIAVQMRRLINSDIRFESATNPFTLLQDFKQLVLCKEKNSFERRGKQFF